MASEYMGHAAHVMTFKDMNFQEKFEGVWANASLLHVSYEELRGILEKIHTSLKKDGIFYASFKYGNQKRTVGGRDFYDMQENLVKPYLQNLFELLYIEKTQDTRSQVAPSPENSWLHILCRKL